MVLSTLKKRSGSELRQLIDFPEEREIQEGGFTARLTSWAREHESGKLGVIVELRQVRFGGIMHSVGVDGFFLALDGNIEPMKEEDLWGYGY